MNLQKIKYIAVYVISSFVTLILSGSIMQTYLLEKGMSEESVGLFFSVMSFVNIGMIALSSKISDKIKDVLKAASLCFLVYLPYLIAVTILSFGDMQGFVLLTVFGIVANISVGFYNIVSYKYPYIIIKDMNDYGKWTGLAGVGSGIFLLLFSTLFTVMERKIGFFPSFRIIGIAAVISAVIGVFIFLTFKKIKNYDNEKPKQKFNLLKYKPFTKLIIPNLLRGIASGAFSMAVTIGYFVGKIDSSSANILLIITQTATIPGSMVYTKFAGREKWLIITGSIGMLISMSMMTLFDTTLFLLFYGIAYFCLMLIDNAVPVMVANIIDYEVAGEYSGWRMMLHTAGRLIANLIVIPIMKLIGAPAAMIVFGMLQLVSGSGYFMYIKKNGTKWKPAE